MQSVFSRTGTVSPRFVRGTGSLFRFHFLASVPRLMVLNSAVPVFPTSEAFAQEIEYCSGTFDEFVRIAFDEVFPVCGVAQSWHCESCHLVVKAHRSRLSGRVDRI